MLFKILFLLLGFTLFSNETKSEQIKRGDVENILNWGVDGQIVSLINSLSEEKNETYNSEIEKIFSKTISVDVKTAIIRYWIAIDNIKFLDEAIEILKNYSTYSRDYLIGVMDYIKKNYSSLDKDKLKPILQDIISYENWTLFSKAMDLIKEVKAKEYGDFLYNNYSDYSIDEQQKLVYLETLAILNYDKILDELINIIEQDSDRKDIKICAIKGLSNYDDDRAYQQLKNLLNNEDFFIRKSTIDSILKSNLQNKDDIILLALKDSHWRIRKDIIFYIRDNKLEQFADILEFKANSDPENVIRQSAIMALSSFKNSLSDESLSKIFFSDKRSDDIRLMAYSGLSDEKINSMADELLEILKKSNMISKTRFYETICAKLSKQKGENLEKVFIYLFSQKNIIKYYGLLGIYNNKFSCCKDEIEKLAESNSKGILFDLAKKIIQNE